MVSVGQWSGRSTLRTISRHFMICNIKVKILRETVILSQFVFKKFRCGFLLYYRDVSCLNVMYKVICTETSKYTKKINII